MNLFLSLVDDLDCLSRVTMAAIRVGALGTIRDNGQVRDAANIVATPGSICRRKLSETVPRHAGVYEYYSAA